MQFVKAPRITRKRGRVVAGSGVAAVAPGGSLTTTTGRIRDDVVRAGVNYKIF